MTIECPGFSELVKCEMDGEYKIAQGWTQSTGQNGEFLYTLPTGWKFDQRYTDVDGYIGSHGGCSSCIMTLVHLITVDPVDDITIPEPARSLPIIILIIGSYILYKLMR